MANKHEWEQAMEGKLNIGKTSKTTRSLGCFHHLTYEINEKGLRRPVDKCSVDIIIPYHCNYSLVRRLLLSILNHTRSNPYLVTLIDDGSPNVKNNDNSVGASEEFIQTLQQAPQTQIFRLEKQVGFGAAVSYGLSKTSQPYVCVIHSDCQVKHMNWLESMGEALVKNKKDNVRFVCARSNNPTDDSIPELKLEYNNFSKTSFENDVSVVDSPLPMYCFMCHRDLFNKIGSIKHYPYTWFENEEFFYRMKKAGFKQAVSMKSWVHHKGSATVNYLLKNHANPKSVKEEMDLNRDRCITDIRQILKR